MRDPFWFLLGQDGRLQSVECDKTSVFGEEVLGVGFGRGVGSPLGWMGSGSISRGFSIIPCPIPGMASLSERSGIEPSL